MLAYTYDGPCGNVSGSRTFFSKDIQNAKFRPFLPLSVLDHARRLRAITVSVRNLVRVSSLRVTPVMTLKSDTKTKNNNKNNNKMSIQRDPAPGASAAALLPHFHSKHDRFGAELKSRPHLISKLQTTFTFALDDTAAVRSALASARPEYALDAYVVEGAL